MASEAYDRALKLDQQQYRDKTKLAMIQELFAGGSHGKVTATGNTAAPNNAEADAPVIVAAADQAAPAKIAPSPQPQPPKPATENDESKRAQQAIMGWAAAWSSRNVANYLSFYADDFKTPSGETRAAWESARKDRLTSPKYIHVDIRILSTKFIDSNHVSVKFRQSYKSNQLQAAGNKTLLMVKTGDKWLIQEELSK